MSRSPVVVNLKKQKMNRTNKAVVFVLLVLGCMVFPRKVLCVNGNAEVMKAERHSKAGFLCGMSKGCVRSAVGGLESNE